MEAHAARALHHGLDDDGGELVGVLGELPLERGVSSAERRRRTAAGGAGAKTCRGSTPDHSACIPPSGSHTDIGVKVSPW